VALLHKHFSIRNSEITLRVSFDKGSFTFVTSRPPENVQPCLWAVDQNVLSPIEYLVTQQEIAVQDGIINGLAWELIRYNLHNTYSLIYLPAYPDPGPDGQTYEMTNKKLRLSLVSNRISADLRDAHFAKSAFAFEVFDGEVRVIPRTKCLPCISCIATIDPVNERKIPFEESDVLGTGLSLKGYEFQDNLITQQFISEMYERIN